MEGIICQSIGDQGIIAIPGRLIQDPAEVPRQGIFAVAHLAAIPVVQDGQFVVDLAGFDESIVQHAQIGIINHHEDVEHDLFKILALIG